MGTDRQTKMHGCRREAERFKLQSDTSSAPPARAFSHVSVKTLNTDVTHTKITDMSTFMNYLESTSDTDLVLSWHIGLG